jgi:hypothetical protein
MKTLALNLDDDLDAILESISSTQGRSKADVAVDALRRYARREGLRTALQDPKLQALYAQLATEDLALAEQGLSDYQSLLEQMDRQ